MKPFVNRISFLGLALLIAPLVFIALNGPVDKPVAFKALLISLSGLALAALGAWCHFLLRRIAALRKEKASGQLEIICFDVSKGSPPHGLSSS
jgi:hypothetical protein